MNSIKAIGNFLKDIDNSLGMQLTLVRSKWKVAKKNVKMCCNENLKNISLKITKAIKS